MTMKLEDALALMKAGRDVGRVRYRPQAKEELAAKEAALEKLVAETTLH